MDDAATFDGSIFRCNEALSRTVQDNPLNFPVALVSSSRARSNKSKAFVGNIPAGVLCHIATGLLTRRFVDGYLADGPSGTQPYARLDVPVGLSKI